MSNLNKDHEKHLVVWSELVLCHLHNYTMEVLWSWSLSTAELTKYGNRIYHHVITK